MTRGLSFLPCFRRQTVIVLVFNVIFAIADPQLDLPPLQQSSPRPGTAYGYNPLTQRPINSPGNQFDVHTPSYQYGSFNPGVINPITGNPGTYSSTTPSYQNRGFNTANGGLNPDIINRGYPDQGRAFDQANRNPLFQNNNNNNFPTTTDRIYGHEDRIDVNNDPNFNRNDPNFSRGNPNYSTSNDEQERRNHQFDERIYQQDIQGIRNFLGQADEQGSKECTNNVAAQWNFETDVNELTQLAALEAQQRYTLFQRSAWETASRVNPAAVRDFSTFRQLRLLSVIGPAALPPDQLDRYNRLINDMLAVYNGATVCAYEDPLRCGLRLQPDLQTIMGTSRDWEELQHVWTEWRRATGRRIRDLYEQLVVLTNQAAKLNNFTNAADYWTFPYESPTFRSEVDNIWEQVKPLYEMVHAYVRRRHRESFGPERVSRAAPLPAHILGDMWGQSWSALLPHVLPYPGKTLVDVSGEMVQQGYTPLSIFQLAEEFFVSMNMSAMPPDFWALSVLEKPHDRHVHCQPSAWDFCNRHDFRIKMCTHVDMKDLVTAHHEMAHIQYFMQYSQLPKVFRDGANPGFHEAIGEAIALSVGSPRHLQTLGLVQKSVDDTAHDINHLFAQALEKVVFLPFALVMDKWRWDVFSGDIRKEEYNCHWWRLREQYTGVKPPVLRSEQDFDPGSKYHIPANIPYIRYFVSTILQFQLHRALCRASGQYNPDDLSKPLHKCDIYKSPEAGHVLKRIMERGSSVPWQQALLDAIGESHLDASALRDYFRPLEEWLRNENLRTNEYIGWTYDGDYCKFSIETAGLQVYGGFYNAATTNFQAVSLLSLMLWSAGAVFVVTGRFR